MAYSTYKKTKQERKKERKTRKALGLPPGEDEDEEYDDPVLRL